MPFVIKDWTGKVCWDGKQFQSFEEAWDWIYEQDPEPDEDADDWTDGWYDDYYAEEVE